MARRDPHRHAVLPYNGAGEPALLTNEPCLATPCHAAPSLAEPFRAKPGTIPQSLNPNLFSSLLIV